MSYIIGIGGVRATGKSTLARNLGLMLRGDVISTGRTREMIRALYAENEQPLLFGSVTNAPSREDSLRYLLAQAALMEAPLQAAIRQCREREATLVLEGTHIYPGFLKGELDFGVLLVAPREKIEYRMHKDKRRRMTPLALERSMELQEYLKAKAGEFSTPVIDTVSLPRALIEIVKLLPPEKLPVTYFD